MKTGNKRRKGFTLIELAIVVAILGALMTIILVSVDFGGVSLETAKMKIKKDKQELRLHLERYASKFGSYPSEEQGLDALVERPTNGEIPETWIPMVSSKDSIKDPWKNPYKLRYDGAGEIQIITFGQDKAEGGEGLNSDFDITKEEQYPPQFASASGAKK
ncbi:type II secretion system protein GspG [Leptospira andrefontaineae]|uniref:Prepilin-type N-terminal cleavage/methylation domain-containing protein n=1 Tax=Leptospira andrefontaineae TaxID=2484976 RepID=A0A4R9H315_9LEPT|nr:type II secretion system protein GspG [Leptospira andrefontaineae]TGK39112.1 prepilin-type N-terminal cleavage/methylation domain-containing protein [Leptospira andrefontaineae]